jgi:hypothetical protein
MYLINKGLVDHYLKNDIVLEWLDFYSKPSDEYLISQQWLRQTPSKRFIFNRMYGDLLTGGGGGSKSLKVLDVGGGLSAMTREFSNRHQYTVVDLLAHDDLKMDLEIKKLFGSGCILEQDWATLKADTYDLVIANDIFPNVDQRLEIFLQNFLTRTKRIRLSLTYYDVPRFYMTKRVDTDEVLCMLAWNSEHLVSVLKKYSTQIVDTNFEIFTQPEESVYQNGRQVCLIDFAGCPPAKVVA